MVKLYTRTGDAGDTGVRGGKRVAKSAPVIEALGTLDELSADLGVLRSLVQENDIKHIIFNMQEILFYIGAAVASPPSEQPRQNPTQGGVADTAALETLMDLLDTELPTLTGFIFAGTTQVSAEAHRCRAVCRRAERRLWALPDSHEHLLAEKIYLNRLSDTLFTIARILTVRAMQTDEFWLPS
jgi:cob(I)alamin adenosyltransferase